ncbi:hypothetical protein [Anabaenopsis elenkinii]|uniref:Uncharacterized protein n=1 Tax=Anabaenopsis elenkinii CCIBt3563 TaxID=2779889 RepID=A0A7S6RC62_9CYAN|nr:hypothetical protein [Anabaenopsis elenkinii]QOV22249.1 hypothetical protein IM676_16410 [Anabaenopsis elenkinii CCIBt3563]
MISNATIQKKASKAAVEQAISDSDRLAVGSMIPINPWKASKTQTS